jgi:hypothetical protein
MIIPPVSPHEVARWAHELTTHTFYVLLLAQPMAFAFGKWLEHTHFKPGTRKSILLTVGIMEWRRRAYVVMDAHYLCDKIISETADKFGMKIVPGGPEGFPGSEIGYRMRQVVYDHDCPCADYRVREYRMIERVIKGIKLTPERIVEYVCYGR